MKTPLPPLHTANKLLPAAVQATSSCKLSVLLHVLLGSNIYIQAYKRILIISSIFYIVCLPWLKCSIVIALVLFLKKFLCFIYHKIKCVAGLLFYMVHGILPREKLSRLMSELGSGGRREALVRALVLHQCGLGSGLMVCKPYMGLSWLISQMHQWTRWIRTDKG